LADIALATVKAMSPNQGTQTKGHQMRQGIYVSANDTFGLYTGFVLIEDNSVLNSSGFRVATFTACTLEHLSKAYPNMSVYLSTQKHILR